MSKGGGERRRRLSRLRAPATGSDSAGRHRFEQLVGEALEQVPEPFRAKLQNVAVVLEEAPARGLLESLGMSRDETLFGLYDGIPLTERGEWYNMVPPDRIVLFRRPILEACETADEVREQVRVTVLHEIAHFYGIGDEELKLMGLD